VSNNSDKSLEDIFNDWLDRFSPPRVMAADKEAKQRDANSLVKIINRFAPSSDKGAWVHTVLEYLEERMTTRSWPAPGELANACKAVPHATNTSNSVQENSALERMIDWQRKFKSQMPVHGSPARTAELIRRGVLRDAREARFRGFDLSDEMAKSVENYPMGREEEERHNRVLNNLRANAESSNQNQKETLPSARAGEAF
jgi:hypothetical protein